MIFAGLLFVHPALARVGVLVPRIKAQITGSLIGTSLLGLGIAIVVGGWSARNRPFRRRERDW